MNDSTNRRTFMAAAAKGTTALTATALVGARRAAGPNERISLGLIGCGGMMGGHVRGLIDRQSAIIFGAICDVDESRLAQTAATIEAAQSIAVKRSTRYEDLLDDKSLDAVIVATPHHWHAPIALRALAAGKDVYLEKPASHVFAEGRRLIDAAQKHRRVLQHGTQMRSSPVTKMAGEILDSGILGSVKVAKAWNVQNRGARQPVADGAPPSGVDYDRWLGPAPVRSFNANRFHNYWRVFRDYGNGDIGDDGVHDIDMAAWGLRAGDHPVRVTAHGSTLHLHGDREYPDNMTVTYQFDNDKVLIYEDRLFTAYGMHGFDSGNAFYGTEGHMIFSRRGYFQVYLGPKSEKGPGVPKNIRGDAGRGYAEHMENFLECVRSRNEPIADAEIAHRTCALVHLGEIAYRTSGRIDFDPVNERVRDNPQADALLTKDYRHPYGLPESV